MHNFSQLAAVAAVSFLLLLAGCAGSKPLPEGNTGPGQPPGMPPSSPGLAAGYLPDAHNELGFLLLRQILQDESSQNVVISPASISLGLSMAYAGAGGETKTAMARTMHLGNLSQTETGAASRSLLSSLASSNGIQLSLANSIWLNSGLGLRQDYQRSMEQDYSARAVTLDFLSPSAADTINGWAGEKTAGKISSVISPGQLAQQEALLVNAVYFKGKWQSQFDSSLTRSRNFTSQDGVQRQLPMMEQAGQFDYLENTELQAVRLPYGDGSASMYVLLPKAGALPAKIGEFAGSIDSGKWKEWLSGLRSRKGTVVFPRLREEYSAGLKQQLVAADMGIAFSDDADFSLMADKPLAISEVLHKTWIDVDEEGTEAAAATVVGMQLTSAGPGSDQQPFYMEVNRPFLFAIQDGRTGEVLFVGAIRRLGNPPIIG